MEQDDDIAAALPEPPRPEASRREAAIAEALRRFDAVDTAAERPRRAGIGRPQAGALIAAALVALIGVPAAWMAIERRAAPVSERGLAFDATDAAETQSPQPAVPSKPTPAAPPAAVAPPADLAYARAADSSADPAPPAAQATASTQAETRTAAARIAPAPARGAFKAVQLGEVNVPPPVITPTAPPAPPPAEQASADAADDASSIIVTGQHRAAGRVPSRGDWNACTVNDPQRSLGSCRKLVDPAAAGQAGRAAAHVADGLSLAWQGDLGGAIAAFDQAVELSPKLAFAYLNRGLAYEQSGDLDRAKADLDRAVRYAPGAARGYYNRGRVLRARGDTTHASADEEQAVAIDWHYEALLK